MTEVAARNARNRRNGSRWQGDITCGLRGAGFDIERLALAGAEDEGDHVVRWPAGRLTIIEAKAGVLHPAEFVRQAIVEADNYARHRGLDRSLVTGVAVAKRRGMNWADAYVLTSVREFFGIGRS